MKNALCHVCDHTNINPPERLTDSSDDSEPTETKTQRLHSRFTKSLLTGRAARHIKTSQRLTAAAAAAPFSG